MSRRSKRTPGLVARGKIVLNRLERQMPWFSPSETLEGCNVRNLYSETIWFGILNGLTATFVSVFALRLGATTGQIGWLTALPALVNILWLLPAARIIERQHHPLRLILRTGLLQRLGYLLMAAMPLLIASGRVEALIVLNTLITVPTAVISTAITALIPDLTSPEHRGQVVSMRWLILSAAATVAALLGGKFLDLVSLPLNYQLLIGVGAAVSLLSFYYLRRIRIPDAVLARRSVPPRQRFSWSGLRRSLGSILSQRDFVRFAGVSFVLHWGLYLPAALWSVLRVRDLGATDTWIGLIAVVVDASTIGGYFFWGRATAKRGNRLVLIVTTLGVSAYTLFTAMVPTIEWMILTSILGGVTWAGCNLALFNAMLGVCPDDRRPTYIALYTSLMNIAAFAAPLLGAALSDWLGIRWVFVASSGVRFLSGVLFLWLVR